MSKKVTKNWVNKNPKNLSVSTIKKKKEKNKIETFSAQNPNDFNGIINYLTVKTGGNIHDNGTIEVTSNSYEEHPKYLLQQQGKFVAKPGEQNAWICFDFKNMEVEISDYSVQSSSSCCIKNWVFEISKDGQNWKVVDTHVNCNDLAPKNIVKNYKVQEKRFVRYCRLRHNGQFINYMPNSFMIISRIELYGRLKMKS